MDEDLKEIEKANILTNKILYFVSNQDEDEIVTLTALQGAVAAYALSSNVSSQDMDKFLKLANKNYKKAQKEYYELITTG
jgi:hypothetical protein